MLLFFVLTLALFSATQQVLSNPGGPIVTIAEFQVGKRPPDLNYNLCMNVWNDGRIHLELRLMPLTCPASLLIYESALSETQFQQLRRILESASVSGLPPAEPADSSAAKTWVRGVEVQIVRGTVVQKTGYFMWGTHAPGDSSRPAHEVLNVPQPGVKAALLPLEDWLQHISSSQLTPVNAASTMCQIDSDNSQSLP